MEKFIKINEVLNLLDRDIQDATNKLNKLVSGNTSYLHDTFENDIRIAKYQYKLRILEDLKGRIK